jgi:hypothetical protein
MSSSTTSARTQSLNIVQNSPKFELDLETQLIIFKKGLFSKTLDPIKEDPKEQRTCTVKCLHKACL